MRTRRTVVAAAVALLVTVSLVGGPAAAKKPPKPPPEPPPQVDTGTIYYRAYPDGLIYSMNPDGSGKTALIPALNPSEPSAKLHVCSTHGTTGRWFLQIRPVGLTTYPNGVPRQELFAVCEGGTAIQLTSDPDLEPDSKGDLAVGLEFESARPRWTANDTEVSYLAKKWDRATGTVVAWGIYSLAIQPDSLSSHVAGAPAHVPVTLDLVNTTQWHGGRMAATYDWKPDGTAIVHIRRAGSYSLVREDYANGIWSTTGLQSHEDCPNPHALRWSPAAARIAFRCEGNIDTMDPYVPSSRTTVIADPEDAKKGPKTVERPCWSPNGTHLVFQWTYAELFPNIDNSYTDVRRVTADGDDDTNLTGDYGGNAVPIGWR